jgi:hypothetical protein
MARNESRKAILGMAGHKSTSPSTLIGLLRDMTRLATNSAELACRVPAKRAQRTVPKQLDHKEVAHATS